MLAMSPVMIILCLILIIVEVGVAGLLGILVLIGGSLFSTVFA